VTSRYPQLSALVADSESSLQRSFKTAKVFKKHAEEGKSYTSMGFDNKGEHLITSGEDETMQLFDVRSGK